VFECIRTGGSGKRIARLDVVLEKNRDAVQWPAHFTCLALLVERTCVGQRFWIYGQHRTVLRTVLVITRDAIEISRRQDFSADRSRSHCSLQSVNRLLGGIECVFHGKSSLAGGGGERQSTHARDKISAIH
jgi:hypothetical protein